MRVLGEIMVRLADRRRLLGRGGEEGRDIRSAAEYRAELREEVVRLGGLDRVVLTGSKPDIQVPVRELGGAGPPSGGLSAVWRGPMPQRETSSPPAPGHGGRRWTTQIRLCGTNRERSSMDSRSR